MLTLAMTTQTPTYGPYTATSGPTVTGLRVRERESTRDLDYGHKGSDQSSRIRVKIIDLPF